MEPPEAVEVRLSDVCRSCLLKADDMTNFSFKTDATSEIIAMLASVGNIEIEINEFLPSYLCKTCEEKLRLSYDFQMLIQRSHEIIRECMAGMETQILDVENEHQGEDEGDIKIKESSSCGGRCPDDSGIIESNSVRCTRKLPEFSPTEVEEAINEFKRQFYYHIKCLKCGFITNNSRSLAIHMAHLHKEIKDKWCSSCNKEVEDLPEHAKKHNYEHFKCKFCEKKFNAKGHFYEHLRTHSRVKAYNCHICHRGFIARRHLQKHLRVHMNNRMYKCSICPRNYENPKLLKLHLNSHVKSTNDEVDITEVKNPYPQNFCKMCKKRVRSLDEHLSKVHNPNRTEPLKKHSDGVLCTECGKKFSTYSRLQLHTRIHTGETPYKCQYCDKRMMSRNHLKLHERTHTGERPYICNICGRGFGQSSVLHTHMKIHTGRPEVCEICKKRFCRPAQLRIHMRKHTGEKPYKCNQCEQAFKQQSHLSEHLRRHSEDRPYKCTFCDKSFKQLSVLKSHLTIHTGEKPFKCSQCPYASRQRHGLTRHMTQHSADAPNPQKPHFCDLCQKGYTTMAMLLSHNDLVHNGLK